MNQLHWVVSAHNAAWFAYASNSEASPSRITLAGSIRCMHIQSYGMPHTPRAGRVTEHACSACMHTHDREASGRVSRHGFFFSCFFSQSWHHRVYCHRGRDCHHGRPLPAACMQLAAARCAQAAQLASSSSGCTGSTRVQRTRVPVRLYRALE